MPPTVSYSAENSTLPILTVTVTELLSFLGHCSFNNPITTPERGCTYSHIWTSFTSHLCPSLAFKSLDNHNYTHCLMDFSKGGKLILKKKKGGSRQPDFVYCRNLLLTHRTKADSTKHHKLNLMVSAESAPCSSGIINEHTKLLLVQRQHKLHNMCLKLFSPSQIRGETKMDSAVFTFSSDTRFQSGTPDETTFITDHLLQSRYQSRSISTFAIVVKSPQVCHLYRFQINRSNKASTELSKLFSSFISPRSAMDIPDPDITCSSAVLLISHKMSKRTSQQPLSLMQLPALWQ